MSDAVNAGREVMGIDFVRSANMSQLGSYGEAIFHETCLKQGMEISTQHFAQADFLMSGRRMDVKTSRQRLERLLERPFLKIRHRIENTEYVAVEFHKGEPFSPLRGRFFAGMTGWNFKESSKSGSMVDSERHINPKSVQKTS